MKANLIGEYTNGNFKNQIYTDGTVIRETINPNDNEFKPSFATNIDLKITDYCDMNCKYCHEGSSIDGKHSDIINEPFIYTLHQYQEVALGGGNILAYPNLTKLLTILKNNKVITNITLNQTHFMQSQDLLQDYIEQGLIHGIGVSLLNPTQDLVNNLIQYPNVVLHIINGIISPQQIQSLFDLEGAEHIKLLILGYKTLRRGKDYINNGNNVSDNMISLSINLPHMLDYFRVVSFDNLALEQLNVKRYLTDEQWNNIYMGNDGTMTFYIDAVQRKFAKNSTALFENRYDLLDNVDDMFKFIQSTKE